MKVRNGARLVLLNDQDEIFLFRSDDLTRIDQKTGQIRSYWVTPGGGVETGESWEDAARREMWEETGIGDCELGPWVWSREKAVVFNGEEILGRERYYLVRCGQREITDENQLEHERRDYQNHRWWSLEDLQQTSDVIYPIGLADLVAPLIEGSIPHEPIRLLE